MGMSTVPHSQVLVALDTPDLSQAIRWVRQLVPVVGGFKIGHALTLNHGLSAVKSLQDAGAERVFVDLKLHDIPSVVGLAVQEMAANGVFMATIHAAGGREMMAAAAAAKGSIKLMAVSVLTSLTADALADEVGLARGPQDHLVWQSRLALDAGCDGLICSPQELRPLRDVIGRDPLLVSPGIRLGESGAADQARTGTYGQALKDGASFVVIGRGVTQSADPLRDLNDALAAV